MQLEHSVFFKLKDAAPERIDALVASAKQHLTNHPGLISFGVGIRNPDLNRPVNDNQYDVSLHCRFENQEAHDAYQIDQRHQLFINEQRDNWAVVRVFDTDLL